MKFNKNASITLNKCWIIPKKNQIKYYGEKRYCFSVDSSRQLYFVLFFCVVVVDIFSHLLHLMRKCSVPFQSIYTAYLSLILDLDSHNNVAVVSVRVSIE